MSHGAPSEKARRWLPGSNNAWEKVLYQASLGRSFVLKADLAVPLCQSNEAVHLGRSLGGVGVSLSCLQSWLARRSHRMFAKKLALRMV